MTNQVAAVELDVTLDKLNFKFNLLCSWLHHKFGDDPTFPTLLHDQFYSHEPSKDHEEDQVQVKIEPNEKQVMTTTECPSHNLDNLQPLSHTSDSLDNNSRAFSADDDNEIEIAEDDDEDDADLISQGWIVTEADGGTVTSPSEGAPEEEFDLSNDTSFIDAVPPEGDSRNNKRKLEYEESPGAGGKIYPKPGFSYPCLAAMALMNSELGNLSVSGFYNFVCYHFPYFRTAPSVWKNSMRHGLSQFFAKIETTGNGGVRGVTWTFQPANRTRLQDTISRYSKKERHAVRKSMSEPDNLELIVRGEMKGEYKGEEFIPAPSPGGSRRQVKRYRVVIPTKKGAAQSDEFTVVYDTRTNQVQPRTHTGVSQTTASLLQPLTLGRYRVIAPKPEHSELKIVSSYTVAGPPDEAMENNS